MRSTLFWLLPILTLFLPRSSCKKTEDKTFGQKDVVFQFDRIVLEGTQTMDETFEPDRTTIRGIKVYKGDVYATIPRHGQSSIPATLVKISKSKGGTVFSPFPNWDFQKLGSCKSLQDATSIQVDPKTDLMYIADNGNGRICKPKLVVYDLTKKVVNSSYTLDQAKDWIHALGDIVVDNQGVVYISNADKFGSLWIIDTKKNGEIFHVQDHSFKGNFFKPFVFGNDTYWSNATISMLALTPDTKYLFYSSNEKALWQVESDIKEQLLTLRLGEIKGARKTGDKNHQGFSMEMGDRFLFFSNLDNKSISYWDRKSDLDKQGEGEGSLVKENEATINIQPPLEYFPGKMSLDEKGYLWVVTMDLPRYFSEKETADRKTKIVKIFVNNRPYNNPEKTVSGSGQIFLSAIIVFVCCLLAAM